MTKSPWRIIFFGTPSFAIPSLKALIEGSDEVVGVVTQPDRPKGRGMRLSPSPVKELALKYGINLLQPEKVRDESFQESIKSLSPEIFVVVAFGQILPGSLIKVPKHGAINVHASLLPKYRGAAPIPWAILNGEDSTGVTIIMMDEGLDTGDILTQMEIQIEKDDTSHSLQEKLSVLGATLLMETIEIMKRGALNPKPQNHSNATYAPLLRKEDGHIDWRKRAEEIDRQVRAFNPWPGAFTKWNGKMLKIFKGETRRRETHAEPGTAIWVGLDFIEVETGDGTFLIKEVQLEGKKRISVRDFLCGNPIPHGTIFT